MAVSDAQVHLIRNSVFCPSLISVGMVINNERIEEQEEARVAGYTGWAREQRLLVEVIVKERSIILEVVKRFICSVLAQQLRHFA